MSVDAIGEEPLPMFRLYVSVEIPPQLRSAIGRGQISIEGVVAAAGPEGDYDVALSVRRHLQRMAEDVGDLVRLELRR